MTQSASKVKLLGRMVHDVVVPEDIVLMIGTMGPITRKIQGKKGNYIHGPSGLNREKGELGKKPLVGNDRYAKPKHILGHIGDARTQTCNHVRYRNSILSLPNAPSFFKENQHKKCWHSNQ